MPLILILLLALILASIYLANTSTTPRYEDSIGYVLAGERLASGNGPTYEDPNNELAGPYFVLSAFQIRRDDDSRMFLGYPPGYPLLIALGIAISGTGTAAHYIVPTLAILGILLVFVLGRLLSGSNWVGFWSALIIGLTPAYIEFGTAAWSEIPATAMMLAGVCLYLVSLRTKSQGWIVFSSILGGLFLGYSFFVRYTNMIILPAIVVYEILANKAAIRDERERWPFYIVLGIGIAGIFLFNDAYYGGPLTTSYSPVHGWYPHPPFSLTYMVGPSFVNGKSLLESGVTLWDNYSIALFLVPIGWYLLPRPSGAFSAVALLGFIAVYSVYAFAPSGINSRFLIPAFPFIAVSVGQAVHGLGLHIPWTPVRRIAGVILFLILLIPLPMMFRTLDERNTNDVAARSLAESIASHTESGSVVLTYAHNDRLAYYGDRSVLNYRRIPDSDPAEERYRLEMLEPCLVASVNVLLNQGIPVYYVEDSFPPFWNSLEILSDHFLIVVVAEEPLPIYQVSLDGASKLEESSYEEYGCEVPSYSALPEQGMTRSSLDSG